MDHYEEFKYGTQMKKLVNHGDNLSRVRLQVGCGSSPDETYPVT